MSNQIIFPRALDANGYVSPAAKARVTLSGTDTLVTVYSDAAGTIPAANPVIADANGLFPQRYVDGQVRVAYSTSTDVTLFTQDPAPAVQSTGSGASEISFEPTVDLPFTDVQSAIEGAAAASAAGFAAFGIGITGNATLLANLDATGLGAGVYRFDGTTTGTFPSGVTAADTGIVETWRQTSALAMMELGHATSDRIWQRRLSGGVWGTWREIITANQAATRGDLIRRGATAFERLTPTAAGQAVVYNGTDTVFGSTISTQTAVTPTGVTFVDLTGIPATAQRVTVTIVDLSATGTDAVAFQLGTTASVENTLYGGTSSVVAPGNSCGTVANGSAFLINAGTNNNNAAIRQGAVVFQKVSGNTWMATGNFGLSNGPVGCFFAGVKTLADTLTRVRVLTTGANTFDGGSIVISWE